MNYNDALNQTHYDEGRCGLTELGLIKYFTRMKSRKGFNQTHGPNSGSETTDKRKHIEVKDQ